MMLHTTACAVCGTPNQFYDPSCQVKEKNSSAAMAEIMSIAEIGDPPRFPEPALGPKAVSAPPLHQSSNSLLPTNPAAPSQAQPDTNESRPQKIQSTQPMRAMNQKFEVASNSQS